MGHHTINSKLMLGNGPGGELGLAMELYRDGVKDERGRVYGSPGTSVIVTIPEMHESVVASTLYHKLDSARGLLSLQIVAPMVLLEASIANDASDLEPWAAFGLTLDLPELKQQLENADPKMAGYGFAPADTLIRDCVTIVNEYVVPSMDHPLYVPLITRDVTLLAADEPLAFVQVGLRLDDVGGQRGVAKLVAFPVPLSRLDKVPKRWFALEDGERAIWLGRIGISVSGKVVFESAGTIIHNMTCPTRNLAALLQGFVRGHDGTPEPDVIDDHDHPVH